MIDLIIIKFIVGVTVVLGLSLISERINPRIAGFISGLPTGTLITLFFFGIEFGPEFASKSAVFNLGGILGMLTFIFIYYKGTGWFRENTMILSSLCAIIGYFIIIGLINFANMGVINNAILVTISIPFFIYLFKDIKNTEIHWKLKLSFSDVILRSLVATSIIVLVTSIGATVGPSWAGLLSAFPTTLFPLIIITHMYYEKENVNTIIKNVPHGVLGLVIYSLGVFYFYPTVGVYLGTAAAYLLVVIYSISYFLAFKK